VSSKKGRLLVILKEAVYGFQKKPLTTRAGERRKGGKEILQ